MILRPNIVLIILDSVRYDRCSWSGCRHDATPNLARFGDLYFHNAFSTSTWSLPAHASIFSGLYPSQHGVHAGKGGRFQFQGLPSFAEKLQKSGYVTIAFSANPLISSFLGFNKGFQEFYELQRRILSPPLPIPRKTEDPVGHNIRIVLIRTLRKGIRWLYYRTIRHLFSTFNQDAERINKCIKSRLLNVDEPFFVVINHIDAHDYESNLGLTQRIRCRSRKNAYDHTLSYLDDALGDLFQFLESRGYLNRTAILVTSDHGEMLGERGKLHHSDNYPHNPLIHVPFLVKDPNIAHRGRIDVDKVFSIKDIGQIILGMAEGKSCLECIKTLPDWCGVEGIGTIDKIEWSVETGGTKFLKVNTIDSDRYRAIITSSHKLVHDICNEKFELYHLSRDEGEYYDKNKSRFQELVSILREWEKELMRIPPENLFTSEEKEEIERRLKTLGYI